MKSYYSQDGITIYCGDCLEILPILPDKSVDLVLTDPPYGTTACKWDTYIPFIPMWEQLKRITKKNGAIALFGNQPFTSALVMSNPKMFKYEWVWDKITGRGHLVAKYRPMAQHENISIFGNGKITYNPQMIKRDKPIKGTEGKRTDIMGGKSVGYSKVYTHAYPKTIQTFGMDKRVGHPTQKPVILMEYLIKTYINRGEVVLDFAMGSGTTAVACKKLDRKCIGIEISEKYCEMAVRRLKNTQKEMFV